MVGSGPRAVNHVSCIRVRARMALTLMRGAFGARIGMRMFAECSIGVCLKCRTCVWWHGRFVQGHAAICNRWVLVLHPYKRAQDAGFD